MKQYLRELPEPLLTFDLYTDWTDVLHLLVNDIFMTFALSLSRLASYEDSIFELFHLLFIV